MTQWRFEGRTVIVTGWGSGLGEVCARPLDDITDADVLASVQGAKPELCGPLAAHLVHEGFGADVSTVDRSGDQAA